MNTKTTVIFLFSLCLVWPVIFGGAEYGSAPTGSGAQGAPISTPNPGPGAGMPNPGIGAEAGVSAGSAEAKGEGTQPVVWEPEEVSKGITTGVDDYHGNWFLKKQLLGEARKANSIIRTLAEGISRYKERFTTERTELNNKLNSFYVEFTIQSGSIDTILGKIDELLAGQHKDNPLVTDEERSQIIQLEQKRALLDELKINSKLIRDLDTNFDKGLTIFSEQEERARSYEHGAWELYEKMEEVLSDERAEQMFLQIKSAADNLEAIKQYAEVDFTAYVKKTVDEINKAIDTIKQTVQKLKEQGIVLEEEIAAAGQKAEGPLVPLPKPAPKKARSWRQTITDAVWAPFGWAGEKITSLWGRPSTSQKGKAGATKPEIKPGGKPAVSTEHQAQVAAQLPKPSSPLLEQTKVEQAKVTVKSQPVQ